MANYIGAKTAGVIANIDGGMIENATISNTVTINAGSNVSGIGQLIGISFSLSLIHI